LLQIRHEFAKVIYLFDIRVKVIEMLYHSFRDEEMSEQTNIQSS